mmetsp:Transcript_9039/g.12620  ORF Transcript_9039/g.12620 Transcript_9039/m.12620 type:complete len:267 (+) Transcript_9039:175-975(+)
MIFMHLFVLVLSSTYAQKNSEIEESENATVTTQIPNETLAKIQTVPVADIQNQTSVAPMTLDEIPIRIKGQILDTSSPQPNVSMLWYIVTAICFCYLAYRNRKQLSQLLTWTRTSTGPVYHRMGQLWESASENTKWIPNFPRTSLGRLWTSIPKFNGVSAWFISQRSAEKEKHSRRKPNSDIELVQVSYEYTPQLLNYRISPILSKPVAKELTKHLPAAMQLDDWKLLYSSNEHGSLLTTFYEKVVGRGPSVLIVKDETNAVISSV